MARIDFDSYIIDIQQFTCKQKKEAAFWYYKPTIVLLQSLFTRRKNDSVAQLVEQYTFNVWVLGSNPSGITDAERETERGNAY